MTTCFKCLVETELLWLKPFPICLECSKLPLSDEEWLGYITQQNIVDFYKELEN